MNIEQKLNQLFADRTYVEKISDLSELDDIFAAVSADVPGLTREELDRYLTKVSESLETADETELNEEALDQVAGGVIWETVAAVCAVITFCYCAGYAIGKAIKNWKKNHS